MFLEQLPPHPNIVRYLFHKFDHEKGKARLFMTKYALSLRDEIVRRKVDLFVCFLVFIFASPCCLSKARHRRSALWSDLVFVLPKVRAFGRIVFRAARSRVFFCSGGRSRFARRCAGPLFPPFPSGAPPRLGEGKQEKAFVLMFHKKSDNIFVKLGQDGEMVRLLIGDFDTAKNMKVCAFSWFCFFETFLLLGAAQSIFYDGNSRIHPARSLESRERRWVS